MSRLLRMLNFTEGRPELVIEVILALTLLVFAVYLGGPWYVAGPSTVVGNSIDANVVRFTTFIVYIVPSVVSLIGVFKGNPVWRQRGTFGLFLAYLFTVLIRWLTVGFTPLLWTHALALAFIAAVIYIVEWRTEVTQSLRVDDE